MGPAVPGQRASHHTRSRAASDFCLRLGPPSFSVNGFVAVIVFIGVMSFLISFLAPFGDWRVAVFGLRCNFLHLPLIFIIGRVFSYEDVRRVGWCVLALSIPMAALMALQFRSPSDAWINRGAGEDAMMIASFDGRIRPSGTFSFISGIIYYCSLVTAFLVYGLMQKKVYPWWLTIAAGGALPLALAVSSSRGTVARHAPSCCWRWPGPLCAGHPSRSRPASCL